MSEYRILEDTLPKELLEQLPPKLKEAIHSGVSFIRIGEAYRELKNGSERGFYEYRYSISKKTMILDMTNYDQRCKTIKKQVEELEPYLKSTEMIPFPRKPIDIAKELYHSLTGSIKIKKEAIYRNPDADTVVYLAEAEVMDIVKIVTGYKKAIQRSMGEKFGDNIKYQIHKSMKL